MAEQIDYNSPVGMQAAAEMLQRHENYELEANITSAIRQFLTQTGLAKSDEIKEEDPPSDGARRAVDLTALDTFIEVKRRIGTGAGNTPNDDYVRQLDDYLRQSAAHGRQRMGILTDGKHWLLRWPNLGAPKMVRPYAYTLDAADRWGGLHQWLLTEALVSLDNIRPDRLEIDRQFGPNSPRYQQEIRELTTLYGRFESHETMQVKRRLWFDLLRTAMREIATTQKELDDLFVQHTYLVAVIGMAVQARFGIDLKQLAENSPDDLLTGGHFFNQTGLQGVVESDFFAWPNEVDGGARFLQAVARRLARFDWQQASADIASILYEAVIPADERRQLGEYYTPAWLARAVVRELVPEPLGKTILDPACGSGTFVAEAVAHLLDATKDAGLSAKETLDWLRISVVGVDIHPVAVHLARAAWVLAAQPAIQAAMTQGFTGPVTVPIYLGDSLQLRFRTDDMFGEHEITIYAQDKDGNEIALVFPRSLVNKAENFDALMGDVSAYIKDRQDPHQALDNNHIAADERPALGKTISSLQELHAQGLDHIWAYYTRNLVRPAALASQKVDVIIGNPPWINYNQTTGDLRSGLERLSKQTYGIWRGGHYATHQDVAGLFFARSVDLYLKDGGVIGMVMPHSALQAGQYAKWRTGVWSGGRGLATLSVDFSYKAAWDLERLEPNTFFPIPASVAFAQRLGVADKGVPLAGQVERWRGQTGTDDMHREPAGIADMSIAGASPYAAHSRQGATIVPRRLFFVEEVENTAIIQAGQTVTVKPRTSANDKSPWKDLDLTSITSQTIELAHVFDVHLGESVVPFATLDPRKAILPLSREDASLPADAEGVGGIRLAQLERRMRGRWQIVSRFWEDNKAAANNLRLAGRLDYHGELSAQLNWQRDTGDRPLRIVYSSAGQPTAALLPDDEVIVDYKLFWTVCAQPEEADYLLAIINSDTLHRAVSPLMSKGQFGARDVQKHLWKLPIPEFDASNALHSEISAAGEKAAAGVANQLKELRHSRGDGLTVTIARRELRKWLRTSPEGTAVEKAVSRLLEAA